MVQAWLLRDIWAHQAKIEGLSCSACHEFHLATASCGGIPVTWAESDVQ